jgi:hypothetical protein
MSTQSLPGTRFLEEVEKSASHHLQNDARFISEHDRPTLETSVRSGFKGAQGHDLEKESPGSGINYSEWDGADDPQNPYNCVQYSMIAVRGCKLTENNHLGPTGKKFYHAAAPALFGFAV